MSHAFIPVAQVSEIPPGTAKAVTVGDREIAVFHAAGAFYAIDNICPHQGAPLAVGYIDGVTVTCPWHAWCFGLADGKMTLGDFAEVDTFAVRVENCVIAVAPLGEGVA